MKRIEVQKRLATAAKTVATKIENANVTPTGSGYVVLSGAPTDNAVGLVLRRAGISFAKTETIFDPDSAVAKALGTSTDVLPSSVVSSLRTAKRGTGYQAASALRSFAEALTAAPIRKKYTKSGLFTQAARDAGTFGKSAASAQ